MPLLNQLPEQSRLGFMVGYFIFALFKVRLVELHGRPVEQQLLAVKPVLKKEEFIFQHYHGPAFGEGRVMWKELVRKNERDYLHES